MKEDLKFETSHHRKEGKILAVEWFDSPFPRYGFYYLEREKKTLDNKKLVLRIRRKNVSVISFVILLFLAMVIVKKRISR